MSNKHGKVPAGDERLVDETKANPGIGTSKGTRATGADPGDIEGVNTVEGDVGNDTTPEGGVDPNHLGRTNK